MELNNLTKEKFYGIVHIISIYFFPKIFQDWENRYIPKDFQTNLEANVEKQQAYTI